MLKTNTVFYFDSSDFINISHHYIDQANFSLAEKAIKMGLDQHPNNIDLMLIGPEVPLVEGLSDFFASDPELKKVALSTFALSILFWLTLVFLS